MESWWRDASRLFKLIAYIFLILLFIFVINQLLGIFQFLGQINQYLAIGIVFILTCTFLYLIYKLRQQWKNQPQVLEVADMTNQALYDDYLEKMVLQLQSNPNLNTYDFDQAGIEKVTLVQGALNQLHQSSLPLIKENANAIFLSTAISQNGSLDSLVVLFTLMRMVWQLSNHYQTRPSLKGTLKLYGQIASVVLMARSIEDMDLIEGQLEPLITSVIGESLVSIIPGMVPLTNLVVSSLLEGSVNAFLTLRVGLIAQEYLGAMQAPDKQMIRKNASLQAITYMGAILSDNGKVVIKSIVKAAKSAGKGAKKKLFS